jgi:hypothetical protein
VLANGVEEFLAREWLGDVLLGADDAATRLVEQAVLGRQHDHRRVLEHLVVLDQRAGLVAIQSRHHDVDEDDLRLLVGDLGQCLEAIGRGRDFGPLALEQGFSGPADGFRVVDHHHPQAPEAAGATVVLRHLRIPPCAALRECRRRCKPSYIPVGRHTVKHSCLRRQAKCHTVRNIVPVAC